MVELPSFEHWFAGVALFQAAAFLFASIVGIIGIRHMIPRRSYSMLWGVAVFLAAVAWWQAAKQGESAKQQAELASRVDKGIHGIAKNLEVKGQTTEKLIEGISKEVDHLRTQADATASFLGPESIELIGGSYIVRGTFRINATTPKSGLTFGFTAEDFQDFRIVGATEPIVMCGKYELPFLTELGTTRFHCRNVNGAYLFELRVGSPGPVTIRHRLEGKEEGAVVTWQIHKP